ncbi:ATP-binding protein [uncultured Lacinutrix sp.]|uniref:sensor histidine kinase n=1 Tax=uncultured Lacinutrix sp. TaxID=574032 RepID=UPI002612A0E8|nr:ATP-binding protein [uncultured Lacinutrix sp.]
MGENTIIISLILFSIFFIAFIVAIIVFIREYKIKKKAHTNELETKDVFHKKELLETRIEIQTQTMRHIGREIHDNVGQKLTLSSMYLQQLVFENKAPNIAKSINNINDIINESLIELRHLSRSLTDDTIENNSIAELIEKECIKMRDLKQCEVVFENELEIYIVSYQIKSVLLRIVQEFVQNSIKHSQCEKIDIILRNSKNEVQMILKDDGNGFDINNIKSQGIGLKNIKKRVIILKGDFILNSDKKGTRLTIKIPA